VWAAIRAGRLILAAGGAIVAVVLSKQGLA
jgi:hypothetical protein